MKNKLREGYKFIIASGDNNNNKKCKSPSLCRVKAAGLYLFLKECMHMCYCFLLVQNGRVIILIYK